MIGILSLLMLSACSKVIDSKYPIEAHEFVILSTASTQYRSLTNEISHYYQAPVLNFDKISQSELIRKLRVIDPLYALIVVPPEKITTVTARSLFEAFCSVHDEPEDPYLDVAFGYISGLDSEDARELFHRAKADVDTMHNYVGLSHVYDLDVYCHNKVNDFGSYYSHGGWDTTSVIEGGPRWLQDRDAELAKFSGNQLIFCCGHGSYFSLCGIREEHFEHMDLNHSIIVSGACYTGGIFPPDPSACIAMLAIAHGASIHIANMSLNGWMYMEHIALGIYYYDQSVGISFRDGLNIVYQEYQQYDLNTLPCVILYGDPSYRPVVARWR
ncbi:hypothetical protein ACFL6R_04425 [Gemmatimonadota bacterium]